MNNTRDLTISTPVHKVMTKLVSTIEDSLVKSDPTAIYQKRECVVFWIFCNTVWKKT